MVTLANRNLQAAGPSPRAEVRQDDVAALPFDETEYWHSRVFDRRVFLGWTCAR
jgi:hypothetical protein